MRRGRSIVERWERDGLLLLAEAVQDLAALGLERDIAGPGVEVAGVEGLGVCL